MERAHEEEKKAKKREHFKLTPINFLEFVNINIDSNSNIIMATKKKKKDDDWLEELGSNRYYGGV